MRFFEIDKENWPCGVSDGLTLNCSICGEVPNFDYCIKDELWDEIVPKDFRRGVICLPCFAELALKKGVDAKVLGEGMERIQFCAPGLTVEFIPANVFVYLK